MRTGLRTLAAVLGAALLATACGRGDDAPRDMATVDTLASGLPVVHNALPEDRFGSESWTITETLRIGSVAGEGPDVFGDNRGLTVDEAGSVYVLDRMAGEIRVFGPDGSHLRSFASKGEGPGELDEPHGLVRGPEGRLWVPDHAAYRFTEFDTTGGVIETHRSEFLISSFLWNGVVDSAGRIVDRGLDFRPGEERSEILRRTDLSSGTIDTFPFPATPQGWEPAFFRFESRTGGGVMQVPFKRGHLWELDGRGHVWFGVGEDYRIYKRSLEGDTLLALTGRVAPVAVGEEERAAAVERLLDFRNRIGGGTPDLSRIPDTKDPMQNFFFDDRGRLWVQVAADAASGARFDVFGQDGRWVASVRTDVTVPYLRDPVIQGDRLYMVVQDSLDVSYVVRGRIER